jgi:hypothetical protein
MRLKAMDVLLPLHGWKLITVGIQNLCLRGLRMLLSIKIRLLIFSGTSLSQQKENIACSTTLPYLPCVSYRRMITKLRLSIR